VDWATPTWTLAESKRSPGRRHKGPTRLEQPWCGEADPDNKSSEIVVSTAVPQVQAWPEKIRPRGVREGDYSERGAISEIKRAAPPDLLEPLNSRRSSWKTPRPRRFRFEWKPVQDPYPITLRISTPRCYEDRERKCQGQRTAVEITGLDPATILERHGHGWKKQTSEVSAISNLRWWARQVAGNGS